VAIALALVPTVGTTPLNAQDTSTHPEGGYAVEDETVVARCSRCHAQDDRGRMTRISYLRKTPEGWQTSIRRMVTLNGIDLSSEDARVIVKYLADHQGIAPEELEPARYESERRLVDWVYEADRDVEETCIACHSMGRVVTQRRTREEWELLIATHRGYYPLVDFQAFRRSGPPPTAPGPDGSPPDTRHPMDRAIDHFSSVFPLETPEWSAWSATMRPPRLEGTWAISGYQAGLGPVFGTLDIVRADGEDSFSTTTRLHFAATGRSMARTGQATVYTGYQWRGRSSTDADGAQGLREVMVVERDWQHMSGRWFAGAYDEVGIDVAARRVTGPNLVGLHPSAVRIGRAQTVTLYGAALPTTLDPGAFDFGPGVRVTDVAGATTDRITLTVDVDPTATVGQRDLFVAGTSLARAVTVFDEVHRIVVAPDWGMARVGGGNFPKGYQQFEALAYHDGPDGEAGTEDDLALGAVDASWHLEEYAATYGDDDVAFVGTIDEDGLFTPGLDGPNPERSGNRNNIGDVWAVATYTTSEGNELRARAHLLVTVPLYVRFDASDPTGPLVRAGAMSR
jgi:quinohemoprotein amine dehydrogenase